MTDPIRPDGVTAEVTDKDQIIVRFNHKDMPPVLLSIAGAEKVGSLVSTQADIAKNGKQA